MKVLTVSRNKLELSRAHLRRPLLAIGRSPTADMLLRAPDVKAIHFIVEWIGSGSFDPSQGSWSIVDISSDPGAADSGEGVILTDTPIEIGGFVFACIEDPLESSEVIGGRIAESLKQGGSSEPDLLELVQVRTDSGAIEEVKHVPVPDRPRKLRVLQKVREFKIQWDPQDRGMATRILLEEMPGAEIFSRGRKLSDVQGLIVKPNDVLQIRWRGLDFFLRFVERIHTPVIRRDVLGDPLLKRLLLGVGALALLLILLVKVLPKKSEPEEALIPPRIAKVEIEQPAPEPKPVPTEPARPPEPVKAPQPMPTATEKAPVAEKPAPEKKPVAAIPIAAPAKKGASASSAPKQNIPPGKAPKTGIGSEAPKTNINAVGLLGVLNKSPSKGEGVKADQLIHGGLITQSVSGSDPSSAKVVIKNPPDGILGSGSKRGGTSSNATLSAASTTLSKADQSDGQGISPIARPTGANGFQLSTSNAKGSASGGGMASLEGSEFSVEGGGLDKETVRRVIASYRGHIRTCYERGLLSQPNLAGKIVYLWTISSSGPVLSVEIKSSSVNSSSLSTCVLEVIQKMSFPAATNKKSTKVIYPFVFQGRR